MLSAKHMIGAWLLAAVLVVAAGCSNARPADRGAGDRGGMAEMTVLYQEVMRHSEQETRRPFREERARAMKALARHAARMLDASADWDSPAGLTAVDDAHRVEVREDIAAFRPALKGVATAADAQNLSQLQKQYDTAITSYQRLISRLDVADASADR